jgi:hypothetical protein
MKIDQFTSAAYSYLSGTCSFFGRWITFPAKLSDVLARGGLKYFIRNK